MNNILDSILSGISALKESGFYNKYDRINGIFSAPVKLIIGLALIITAIVIDNILGFSYKYNYIIAIMAVLGLFSIVNTVFSAIYKIKISYFAYMFINTAGYLLYMLVLSKYSVINGLYTGFFLIIVFAALWVCNMCLMYGKGPARRSLGGLIVNIFTTLAVLIGTVGITALSVIFTEFL